MKEETFFLVFRVQVKKRIFFSTQSENLVCLKLFAQQCFDYCVHTDITNIMNSLTLNYNSVITNITKGCDYDRHFVLHFCSQKTETRQKCAELEAQITSVHSCNYECRRSNCRRNNFLPHSSKRGLNLKINFWTPTT